MKTSEASTLPDYKVNDLGANKLGVKCPRSDCGGKFVVNKKKWLAGYKGYQTATCPYCFKTARRVSPRGGKKK